MSTILERLRTRLLPAVLTALGVTFVTAGLLTYTSSGTGSQGASPASSPSSGPGSSFALLTLPPLGDSPGPSATLPPDRAPTRIVVPALGIDLPIVRPAPDEQFPLCNVAEYAIDPSGVPPKVQPPGGSRPTYLYAHARTGMFLPLLDQSKIANGARMIGMLVQVYTSDNQLFLYDIITVRRHVAYDTDVLSLVGPEPGLWLQTSEGPLETSPKLLVVAQPLSTGPADPADAHPTPRPIVCR